MEVRVTHESTLRRIQKLIDHWRNQIPFQPRDGELEHATETIEDIRALVDEARDD